MPENRPTPVMPQSLRHGSAVPPPFTQGRLYGCRRGEHCSPAQSHVAAKSPGRTLCAPTTQLPAIFGPRRGQCGKRKKSVKKNAALLHFLGFFSLTLLFGVPRGERLAAHNERRQFAAQTRSCGYSPRWGEHCSLPSFASLNRGPLLATPQAPRPGFAASEQRDFFRFLFWSQKRKALREKPIIKGCPRRVGTPGAGTKISAKPIDISRLRC